MALSVGVLAGFNPLQPVAAAPLFKFYVGSWQIIVSNHMFMVTVAAVILLIAISLGVRQNGNMVPRGLRNLIESVCVFLREEVTRPILHGRTDRYIGFIWTVFFFILTLNLLGMVPTEKIVALITGKENHFGGRAARNLKRNRGVQGEITREKAHHRGSSITTSERKGNRHRYGCRCASGWT